MDIINLILEIIAGGAAAFAFALAFWIRREVCRFRGEVSRFRDEVRK